MRLIADQRKEKPRFRGLHHAATTIVREEVRLKPVKCNESGVLYKFVQGLTGIYRGVGPTVCKQGSNQAIRFFLMETMRGVYTCGDLSVQVPYYFVALFGFIAGIFRINLLLPEIKLFNTKVAPVSCATPHST